MAKSSPGAKPRGARLRTWRARRQSMATILAIVASELMGRDTRSSVFDFDAAHDRVAFDHQPFRGICGRHALVVDAPQERNARSEEHTSELQSHSDLVCRLLLEKKK